MAWFVLLGHQVSLLTLYDKTLSILPRHRRLRKVEKILATEHSLQALVAEQWLMSVCTLAEDVVLLLLYALFASRVSQEVVALILSQIFLL